MMNTENRQKNVSHDEMSEENKPARKKPFIKPELKQRETLPEVTGAFAGTFNP